MRRILAAVAVTLVVTLAATLAPAAAAGQAGATAQIAGTVKDASGGVLPGVDVTVTQTATGFMRSAVTDAAGAYTLPNLPIGPYRLEATLTGFRSYVQTGIVLQVGGSPTIDVTLALGDLAEAITVQANTALVETRSTGVGQVIENQRVLELPLNGRQVTDLLLLSPGVTTNTTGGFSSNRSYPTTPISVAGGSPGSTVYLMDGASHNDPGTNFNLPVPFPDALQEFRVETSALPARYGNHASAVVSVATKSGTNELHGSVFEFVRNGAFNAKNAFAVSKDSLKRNQFGGAAGGPIMQNRMFFFGGYQGTITRTDPSTLQAFVPTAEMLRGDFTAAASPACNAGRQVTLAAPFVNNRLDPALFDRVALGYLQYIPVSTDPCGRYNYGYPTPSTDHQIVGKVDYQLSSSNSLFVRHMDIRYDLPYYFDGVNALTTPSVGVENRGRSFVVGDSMSLGTTAINSVRVAAIRSQNTRTPAPFKSPAELGSRITTTPLAGSFTNLSVTNAFSLGGGGNNNAAYDYHVLQISDDLDILRGAHQFTVGIDFMHQRMEVFNTQYSNGQMTFNGTVTGLPLADFLAGRIGQLQQGSDTLLRERSKSLGVYAQDAWRINTHVTVNAGLRFEPYFPLTNDDDHVLLFDAEAFAAGRKSTVYRNAPAGLLFPGDEGYPGHAMSEGNTWRFGPRIGVVIDPRGSGREVVRAAYGLVHDQPAMFHHIRVASVPPWGSLVTLNNVSLSDPYATYPGGNPFPREVGFDAAFPVFGTYWTQQREAKTPYTQHWNVSTQKQFGDDWSATVSYFGNKSSHIWTGMEINPAVHMAGATTGNLNQRRTLFLQNPAEGQYFASVTQLNMDGEANYNALLLSLQKRFADDFSLMANHTWSHCVNDADTQQFLDPFYSQPGDTKADRGDCASDRRHVFNASAVVDIPSAGTGAVQALTRGWQVSGIFQALSGSPLNVTIGRDNALTGMPNQRPNVIGDFELDEPTNEKYFDTAAFALPAVGAYGNLKRNALRGPGTWNVNAVVTRRFALPGAQRLEFRAEAFNLFNHVGPGVAQGVNGFAAAGNPNTVFTNALFGRITTAADPRILQFALKYVF